MKNLDDGASDHHSGTIKVIGIGQSLRGDDAAGLEAVRLWQDTYQLSDQCRNIQVELSELPGIALLELLEGVRFAVLVDAVHTTDSPGTVHQLTEGQLESFTQGAGSAHGWGVAETLSLGRQLIPSSMPAELILIGITAGSLSLGTSLSPQVSAALPEVARLIEHHVSTTCG